MISHAMGIESLASYCLDSGAGLLPFSRSLNIAFRTLHVAHFYLRTIPRLNSYAENRNKLSHLGGVILNITTGDTFWVKKGAQFILIARSISELADEQKKVVNACSRFMDCLTGEYPIPVSFLSKKAELDADLHEDEIRFVSGLSRLPLPLFKLSIRIEMVIQEAFRVMQELFNLSLAMFQLFESLVYDRLTEFTNITGIAIKGLEDSERLKLDSRELIFRLDEMQGVIDRMLTFYKSGYKAKDIIELVKKAEPYEKKGHEMLRSAVKVGKEIAYTTSYITTGYGSQSLVAAPELLVPKFQVRSFDDNYSSSDPSRKARKWDVRGRFHGDD